MKKRLYTALVIVGVLIPLVIIPEIDWLFKLVFVAFSGIASFELLRMFSTKKPLALPVWIITICLTMGLSAIMGGFIGKQSLDWLQTDRIFLYLILSVFIFLITLVFVPSFEADSLGHTFTSLLYAGFGAGSLILVQSKGVYLFVYLMLLSFVTDTFAYLVGVTIGKHKMAPHISPKKSWEGAIGGSLISTITASVFAMNIAWFLPKHTILNQSSVETIFDNIPVFQTLSTPVIWIIIIGMSLVLSAMAQLGDLVASKMKRSYQIKDFGTIFPGHGGVLDRFDSIFFVSMLLVIIFSILHMI